MSKKSIVSVLIFTIPRGAAVECKHFYSSGVWFGLVIFLIYHSARDVSFFSCSVCILPATVPASEGQGGECCLYMSFSLGFVQGYLKVLSLNLYTFKEPRNRFRQTTQTDGIDSLEWIPGRLRRLQTRALFSTIMRFNTVTDCQK